MGAATALLAIGAGISLYNAKVQSDAIGEKGAFDEAQGRANALLAERDANDVIARSGQDIGRVEGKKRKILGSQRASLAAQGIDSNFGSATDVQNETSFMGALDELTIKNNAFREAAGYRMQSSNYRRSADFTSRATKTNQLSTLLTGGAQAADYGYKYLKN